MRRRAQLRGRLRGVGRASLEPRRRSTTRRDAPCGSSQRRRRTELSARRRTAAEADGARPTSQHAESATATPAPTQRMTSKRRTSLSLACAQRLAIALVHDVSPAPRRAAPPRAPARRGAARLAPARQPAAGAPPRTRPPPAGAAGRAGAPGRGCRRAAAAGPPPGPSRLRARCRSAERAAASRSSTKPPNYLRRLHPRRRRSRRARHDDPQHHRQALHLRRQGPNIKANVYSPQKVTVAEAYQAFLSILETNGLTVIPHGASSRSSRPPGVATPDDADLRRRAARAGRGSLRHAPVPPRPHRRRRGGDVLAKFKTKDADITVYAPGNLLIITDTGDEHPAHDAASSRRSTSAAPAIRSGSSRSTTRSATEVAKKHQRDLRRRRRRPRRRAGKPGGAAGAAPAASDPHITKIIADDRTNSLIIVATERAYLRMLELHQAHRRAADGEGEIHVLPLQHATAEELAEDAERRSSPAPAAAPQRGRRAAPRRGGARGAGDRASSRAASRSPPTRRPTRSSSRRRSATTRSLRTSSIGSTAAPPGVHRGGDHGPVGRAHRPSSASATTAARRSTFERRRTTPRLRRQQPAQLDLAVPTPDSLAGARARRARPGHRGLAEPPRHRHLDPGVRHGHAGARHDRRRQRARDAAHPRAPTTSPPRSTSARTSRCRPTSAALGARRPRRARRRGAGAAARSAALGGLGGFGGFAAPRQDVGTKIKVKPHLNDSERGPPRAHRGDQRARRAARARSARSRSASAPRSTKLVVQRSADGRHRRPHPRRGHQRAREDPDPRRHPRARLALPQAHEADEKTQPAARPDAVHHPRPGRSAHDLRAQDAGAAGVPRSLLRLQRQQHVQAAAGLRARERPRRGHPAVVSSTLEERKRARGRDRGRRSSKHARARQPIALPDARRAARPAAPAPPAATPRPPRPRPPPAPAPGPRARGAARAGRAAAAPRRSAPEPARAASRHARRARGVESSERRWSHAAELPRRDPGPARRASRPSGSKPLFATQREKGPSLIDLLVNGEHRRRGDDRAGARRRVRARRSSPRIDVDAIATALATQLPITLREAAQDPRHRRGRRSASTCVVADPLDTVALDDVRALFGKPVEVARRHEPRTSSTRSTASTSDEDGGGELEGDDEHRARTSSSTSSTPTTRRRSSAGSTRLFFQAVQGARERHPHRAGREARSSSATASTASSTSPSAPTSSS